MTLPVLPVDAGPPGLDAMLRLILTSRVYDVCRETPLDSASTPKVMPTTPTASASTNVSRL